MLLDRSDALVIFLNELQAEVETCMLLEYGELDTRRDEIANMFESWCDDLEDVLTSSEGVPEGLTHAKAEWNGLPHSNGAKRMSEEVWPRRSPGHDDKAWRTVSGEPVAKSDAGAAFSFFKADPRLGCSNWGVWRDKNKKDAGARDAVQQADGSFRRNYAAEAAQRSDAVQRWLWRPS